MLSQGLVLGCHLLSQTSSQTTFTFSQVGLSLQMTATLSDDHPQNLSRCVSPQLCQTFLGMGKHSEAFTLAFSALPLQSFPLYFSNTMFVMEGPGTLLQDICHFHRFYLGTKAFSAFKSLTNLGASGFSPQRLGIYTGHILKEILQCLISLPEACGVFVWSGGETQLIICDCLQHKHTQSPSELWMQRKVTGSQKS